MSRRWLCLICLLLVVAAVAAGALVSVRQRGEARAGELVRHSLAAERTVRAKGTLRSGILARGRWHEIRVQQMRDGARSVTSYSHTPKGVRIVDTGKDVVRVDDDSKRAVVMGFSPAPPHPDAVLRNYRPIIEGDTVQAGRSADLLALRSRHHCRLAKRVAVDRQTGFPLRTQTYSADGQLASESVYESVQFDPPLDPKAFEVPAGYARIGRRPERRQLSPSEPPPSLDGGKAVLPTYVPEGYQLEAYYVGPGRHVVGLVEIRYTDGLKDLSLYEHIRGARWRTGPGDHGPEAAEGKAPPGGPGFGQGPGPGPGRGPRGLHEGPGRGERGGGGGGPSGPPPGRRGEAGGPWRPGRGERGGAGGGPSGPGGEPQRRAFGPPTREPQLIASGPNQVWRFLRGQVVVFLAGDLTQEEVLKVAGSIPEK